MASINRKTYLKSDKQLSDEELHFITIVRTMRYYLLVDRLGQGGLD